MTQLPPSKTLQTTTSIAGFLGILDVELRFMFGKKIARVQGMNVKCLFKGVTYEMLQDEKFLAVARHELPCLKELHREFDAATATDKETGRNEWRHMNVRRAQKAKAGG